MLEDMATVAMGGGEVVIIAGGEQGEGLEKCVGSSGGLLYSFVWRWAWGIGDGWFLIPFGLSFVFLTKCLA